MKCMLRRCSDELKNKIRKKYNNFHDSAFNDTD